LPEMQLRYMLNQHLGLYFGGGLNNIVHQAFAAAAKSQ